MYVGNFAFVGLIKNKRASSINNQKFTSKNCESICKLHKFARSFYSSGYREDYLSSFKISLTPPDFHASL
jgi:hypothetical protein